LLYPKGRTDIMAGPTVVVSVLADSKPFKKSMEAIGDSTSKMGKVVKGVGVAVGAAMVAIVAAVGTLAVKAVGDASKLEQSMGGVVAVFKDVAGEVNGFAKDAAANVGLSKNSYNELATIIGTTLKNSGTPLEELAGKTDTLVGRAADLAATFGGPVTEASNAMASALRGEFEPLRRFGVSLNVADINARALADSGKTSADMLTKQEKALAAQALIFEQSADAAGAFARESDTLAGKQERLKATLENISATVGTALLPAFTAATGLALAWVTTLSNSAGFQSFLDGLSSMVTGLLTGSVGLGQFGDIIAVVLAVFSPFGLVIKALIPVLPLLTESLALLASTIGGALVSILPTLTGLLELVVQTLSGALAAVLPVIIGLIVQLADIFVMLLPILLPVIDLLGGVLADALLQLTPVIAILATTLGGVLGSILTALAPVLVVLATLLLQVVTAVLPLINVVLMLVMAVVPILPLFAQLVGALLPPLISLLLALLRPILALISPLLNMLIPVIQFLAAVLGIIIGVVVKVIGAFVSLISGSREADRGIRSVWSGIMSFFAGIPGQIAGAFGNAVGFLYNAGRNIVQGLMNGVRSLAGTIGSFFLNLLPGWIVKPFKLAMGIASPSRLFKMFGAFLPQGLIVGVKSEFGRVKQTMGELSSLVAGSFSPLSGAGVGLSTAYAGTAGASARSLRVDVSGGLGTGAEIGRAVVEAIDEYERLNGKR